jgi:hypothetical protein
VDAPTPFDKGWLVVRRLVHESAYVGVLGRARSRSLGTEGAEALPRWGTLELVSPRIGSNARALIVPDSVDLGRLFGPFEGQASNP